MQPGTGDAMSMTALFDALSVVDFVTTFGAAMEAPALSLLDVQQMAAFPLDSPLLGQCYIALLRCLLREAVSDLKQLSDPQYFIDYQICTVPLRAGYKPMVCKRLHGI